MEIGFTKLGIRGLLFELLLLFFKRILIPRAENENRRERPKGGE